MAKVKAATTIGCASRDHSDSLLIGLAKLPRGLSCQYGLVNAPTPAAPMAELPLATAVMGWVPGRRLSRAAVVAAAHGLYSTFQMAEVAIPTTLFAEIPAADRAVAGTA